MLETPRITEVAAHAAAVVHLVIPRNQIQAVMGGAIGEVMAALGAQGISPAGPLFAHHLAMSAETFDFEVGVPVHHPVAPAGRVQPSVLPGGRVIQTVYRGPYEGLPGAWAEVGSWVKENGHQPGDDLWERYLAGPESSPDPAEWTTELNWPLAR